MVRVAALITLALWCAPASAQGFTFGGGGRDYPYPNEPQYQYPYPYEGARASASRCPRGQAPYQGRCRLVRHLPPR